MIEPEYILLELKWCNSTHTLVISRFFSEPTTLDMQKQYVFPHVDQIIKNNLNGSLLFLRGAPTLEPCR